MKRVVIGCDPYGYALKEAVKHHLIKDGIEVEDLGVHAAEETRAYYEVAAEVASRVSQGEVGRGILVCGTGMGMAIIANSSLACMPPYARTARRQSGRAPSITPTC
jgi:ribose 5-phosphate isomerase B